MEMERPGSMLNANAVPWFPSAAEASNEFSIEHCGIQWWSSHAMATTNLPHVANWSWFAVMPIQQLPGIVAHTQPNHTQQQIEKRPFRSGSGKQSQLPCRMSCDAGATPDTELSSTACDSESSWGDAVSGSECSTPLYEAIDSLTSLPQDLFASLVRAGAAARNRGNHRRVRSPGGTCRLRLADALDQPPPASRRYGSCPNVPPPPPPLAGRRYGPCPDAPPPPPPLAAEL